MFYALVGRVKYNGKIKRYILIDENQNQISKTHSEVMHLVHDNNVVNLAPAGTEFIAKGMLLRSIPLYDEYNNQISGDNPNLIHQKAMIAIANAVNKKEQDKLKNKVNLSKKDEKQQRHEENELGQEVSDDRNENNNAAHTDIFKETEHETSEAMKIAQKLLRKDEYNNLVNKTYNRLEYAIKYSEALMDAKEKTNSIIEQNVDIVVYHRELDANTGISDLDNLILKVGVVGVYNKTKSILESAKKCLKQNILKRDNNYDILENMVKTASVTIESVRDSHVNTGKLIEGNKVLQEQLRKEEEEALEEQKCLEEEQRRQEQYLKDTVKRQVDAIRKVIHDCNIQLNELNISSDFKDKINNINIKIDNSISKNTEEFPEEVLATISEEVEQFKSKLEYKLESLEHKKSNDDFNKEIIRLRDKADSICKTRAITPEKHLDKATKLMEIILNIDELLSVVPENVDENKLIRLQNLKEQIKEKATKEDEAAVRTKIVIELKDKLNNIEKLYDSIAKKDIHTYNGIREISFNIPKIKSMIESFKNEISTIDFQELQVKFNNSTDEIIHKVAILEQKVNSTYNEDQQTLENKFRDIDRQINNYSSHITDAKNRFQHKTIDKTTFIGILNEKREAMLESIKSFDNIKLKALNDNDLTIREYKEQLQQKIEPNIQIINELIDLITTTYVNRLW